MVVVVVEKRTQGRVARRRVVRVLARRVVDADLGRIRVELGRGEGVSRGEEGCALLERVAQGEDEGQDQLAQLCRWGGHRQRCAWHSKQVDTVLTGEEDGARRLVVRLARSQLSLRDVQAASREEGPGSASTTSAREAGLE